MKKKVADEEPTLFSEFLPEVPTEPAKDTLEPAAVAGTAEKKFNDSEAGSAKQAKDLHEPVDEVKPTKTNKIEKTNTYNIKGEKKMKKTEKKQAQETTTVTLQKSTAAKAKRLAMLEGVSVKAYLDKLVDERFARERDKLIAEINNL
jgi:hypothetical protein